MDLIDREELKKAILKWLPEDRCGEEDSGLLFEENIVVSVMMEIEEQPAVDAERVRRGKWENREGYDNWNCSECDHEVVGYDENPVEYGVNYCEKCGAWMNWKQTTEAVEENSFLMQRFMKQE